MTIPAVFIVLFTIIGGAFGDLFHKFGAGVTTGIVLALVASAIWKVCEHRQI